VGSPAADRIRAAAAVASSYLAEAGAEAARRRAAVLVAAVVALEAPHREEVPEDDPRPHRQVGRSS
jgi:hypothetical protein